VFSSPASLVSKDDGQLAVVDEIAEGSGMGVRGKGQWQLFLACRCVKTFAGQPVSARQAGMAIIYNATSIVHQRQQLLHQEEVLPSQD